mgnify:CR=1 FL=1
MINILSYPFFCHEETIFNHSQHVLCDCYFDTVVITQSPALRDEKVETYYDYEMVAGSRRPRILVQTAGHVAGAAYFYQQTAQSAPPGEKHKVSVLLHPLCRVFFCEGKELCFASSKA